MQFYNYKQYFYVVLEDTADVNDTFFCMNIGACSTQYDEEVLLQLTPINILKTKLSICYPCTAYSFSRICSHHFYQDRFSGMWYCVLWCSSTNVLENPQKHGYLFTRLHRIKSKHSVILTFSAVRAKNLTSILLCTEWIFNSAHVTSVVILPN